MSSDRQTKKRRKLRISGLILVLLIIYLIAMFGYYLFTMPIKSITILNNNVLSESEVISSSGLTLDTALFKVFTSGVKGSLKENPLIKDAKIKIGLFGDVTLNITENKVVFINGVNDEVVLENGETTENNNQYKGAPLLVNYVPSDVFKSFANALSKVDSNIIRMISEIEYSPDTYNDIVLDEERFLLRMNDGNMVFVNNVNIEKLNRYQIIVASVEKKGVLYLNSSSQNYIFNSYDSGITEPGDV